MERIWKERKRKNTNTIFFVKNIRITRVLIEIFY